MKQSAWHIATILITIDIMSFKCLNLKMNLVDNSLTMFSSILPVLMAKVAARTLAVYYKYNTNSRSILCSLQYRNLLYTCNDRHTICYTVNASIFRVCYRFSAKFCAHKIRNANVKRPTSNRYH